MLTITCSQWIVLDNLKNGWRYQTNLASKFAEPAYRWAIENEYIKDGKITQAGLGMLLACPNPKGK